MMKLTKEILGIESKCLLLNGKEEVKMDVITVMKRYEMKYVLNKEQLDYLKSALVGHMIVDQYGKTSIASIYYDTPNYHLIRTSIEKPTFKEKIRLRAYGVVERGEPVYLEIKRKCKGIVYKRRVETSETNVAHFLNHEEDNIAEGQIAKELVYFRDYYQNLEPKIMIAYDRTSYKEVEGDIRLTIDENPRYRTYDLNLHTSMDGQPLLPLGSAILEIKVQQEMPLWLASILSEGKIYKTSFSKVGEAYKRCMYLLQTPKERSKSYEITV